MSLKDKEKYAIKRIKIAANYFKRIKLAFSGGKDSIVVYNLVKRAGIKCDIVYQNTTIDPPGHIAFIRKNYKDVKIETPKNGFYKLLTKNGLPNRFQRWCCKVLKESNNKDYDLIITGVRRAESVKRKNYKILGRRKDVFELRPIVDWSDADVWNYIKKYNLIVSKYYYEPYFFDRLGCVLCPLANSKQRIRQAQLFPGHVKAMLKAIKKYMNMHQHLEHVKRYQDEYQMFYYYLTGKTQINEDKNLLFEKDYKKLLEEKLNIKLQ